MYAQYEQYETIVTSVKNIISQIGFIFFYKTSALRIKFIKK